VGSLAHAFYFIFHGFVFYMFGYWMKAGEDMLWFPIAPREKSKKVVLRASSYMYSFRIEFAPNTSCCGINYSLFLIIVSFSVCCACTFVHPHLERCISSNK